MVFILRPLVLVLVLLFWFPVSQPVGSQTQRVLMNLKFRPSAEFVRPLLRVGSGPQNILLCRAFQALEMPGSIPPETPTFYGFLCAPRTALRVNLTRFA
jgi:hypothetical protein